MLLQKNIMSENFLDQKYQELQAIERTAFSVVPLPMSAIKSGIKDVALPVGATIAATHIPLAGPALAATIGQGAHLASAGTHVLANAGMAHIGAQIASALPTGLGIQSTAAALGGATNSVALGIVDGSSYAVGGVAAAAMMGKTIINSGKLAFDKASSQPISQSINQTWGAIYQAAEVLKGLIRQIDQFVNRIQGRDMAEELDQNQQPIQDTVVPEAQTVAEVSGAIPSPEASQDQALDPEAQTVVEANGVVAEPPDPKLKEQYLQLLSENLGEPDLTWEDIQERVNQDPDLGFDYDQRVGFQAQENGIDPDQLSELIANSPEWDGVERPKPTDVEQDKPGVNEDSLEARRMVNEDILEKMGKFVDLQNLSIKLNGEQVVGLGRDGSFLEDKTSITTDQAQIIRDVLDNPKAHPGTEITIKVGTRVAFRLKDGMVQPDKFGIAQKSQELDAKTPEATKEQIDALSPEQKKLVADMKKMGVDTTNTINTMVHKTQTNRPVIPKSEERDVAMSR